MPDRIGEWPATLQRDPDDRLVLRWRGEAFDLATTLIRHRDDEGVVTFTAGGLTTTYRRRGPSNRQLWFDRIDVTSDEPWTWEDSDFGLFVFHIATGTGPLKYRHRYDPANGDNAAQSHWPPSIEDGWLIRERTNARAEMVDLANLQELRAKFEVSGIWSELTVLNLASDGRLALVPIQGARDRTWVEKHLWPVLRTLAGWTAYEDDRLRRALDYAARNPIGPTEDESLADWAEWGIWSHPG